MTIFDNRQGPPLLPRLLVMSFVFPAIGPGMLGCLWQSLWDWYFRVKGFSTEHGRGIIVQTNKAEDGIRIRCRVSCRNQILQNSKFVWRAQLLKCYLIKYLKSKPFYIFDQEWPRCATCVVQLYDYLDIMW